jgi:hypothetical protein
MSPLCGKVTKLPDKLVTTVASAPLWATLPTVKEADNCGRRSKLNCDDDPARVSRRHFNHIPIPEIGFEASGSFCGELIVTKCYSRIAKLSTALQSV